MATKRTSRRAPRGIAAASSGEDAAGAVPSTATPAPSGPAPAEDVGPSAADAASGPADAGAATTIATAAPTVHAAAGAATTTDTAAASGHDAPGTPTATAPPAPSGPAASGGAGAPSGPADAGGAGLRVRMFRHGLGDCFLISILRPKSKSFHLMIDCGVILGTPEARLRLTSVIGDIIKETNGKVDVLAVTHEHYDHVAGFVLAPELFVVGGGDPGEPPSQLSVGEVWFAWTENPDNQMAKDLRAERSKHVEALSKLADKLTMAGGAETAADALSKLVDKLTSPDAVEAAGVLSKLSKQLTTTPGTAKQAVAVLSKLTNNSTVSAAAKEAAAALSKLAAAEEMGAGVVDTLRFFGVDGKDNKIGQTAKAMDKARSLAPADGVKYRTPKDVITLPAAPELRFYVLGPPSDRANLMKTDSRSEVYAFQMAALAASVGLAVGRPSEDGNADPSAPFDPAWAYDLNSLANDRGSDPLAEFFAARYFGAQTPSAEADVSWRRIDGAWTASAEALALALDGATNNTSLVLAIEIVASKKVLLFPADAQVGNWLSWHGLTFPEGGTAADLLARTVFYKVGHHGSHNATMKAKGLEMMKEGLTAFVPVDHAMAVKKHWGKMPLEAIMAELANKAKNGGCVVRIDTPLSGQPNVTDGDPGGPFGTRWFDWTLPL